MAKKIRLMPMGNPADYPLGSPESRAAARAMLEAMPMEESENITPEERLERIRKILRDGARRIELGYKPRPITDPALLKRVNAFKEILRRQ